MLLKSAHAMISALKYWISILWITSLAIAAAVADAVVLGPSDQVDDWHDDGHHLMRDQPDGSASIHSVRGTPSLPPEGNRAR